MAKIKKQDLEILTNEQIKEFYKCENYLNIKIPIIKDYLYENKEVSFLGNKINRIESLLNVIIVERFINDKLNEK